MRVLHANDAIAEVFAVTGFDSLIHIEKASVPSEDYRLSISSLLRKRMETDAKRTAYIYLGREYTWEDIDKASQIIATDLDSLGVKKGTHVGVCAMSSINWVFTLFATQKLGAIAVLINPGLRPAEVLSIAQVGEITHLCYGELPGTTEFAAYKQACLSGKHIRFMYDISARIDFTQRFEEYPALADRYSENRLADDASVIIFSSGSTGKPKAILSSSFNLMNSVEPLITEMRVCSEDINLAFLPMFHVFGFATGISCALLTGLVAGRLAKYKIPSFFVLMESFPLLGSGKVDTISLKQLVIHSVKKD